MQRKKQMQKSESSSKGRKKQIDENSWRDALDAISINDDEWWCIVIMMVETITEHSRCVSLFNAAAEEGRRKAIYTLSCQKTLASVRALSKQSLDKCPAIQGVCHYANKVLNGDNDLLPSWLMARIIKYLIYRAREESIGIVKRLADLEREIDEEYWIMQTIADWGQPGSKKLDPSKFNRKANTKLRKRGEEWRDAVYVDDAPANGPNLYIILTGFHDPDLLKHLINIGVPLSCILQIKRPNERLDHPVRNEANERESSESKKLQFLEEYSASKLKLFNFWTKVKERSMDPETYPEYCDIGFLVYCPVEHLAASNDDEYEAQKKDMYDKVSYIVYDFYDVYRQHGNYLKSMKVETGIAGESTEKASMEVYECLLNAFPLECVSVPLILFAILMQVEATERRITMENTVDEKGDARITEKNDVDTETEAVITSKSPVSFVERKMKTLNIKFDLDDKEYSIDNGEQSVTDIDLIPHGDFLLETIRLLDDSAIARFLKPEESLDNILPVFRHPIITNLHKTAGISAKKFNEYSRHIDNIRRYFDVQISNEEIRHYLHILMFDRMMHRMTEPKNSSSKDAVDAGSGSSSTLLIKRCKSLPSLTSESTAEIRLLSDGNIDYGKAIPEIIECSPLFDLIDPRELLVPGYLERNVFKTRVAAGGLRLEDFSDVELLSKPIFLQLLHESLLSFDHVKIRYFEPTDSLLLYFGNKWRINGVNKEERMSSIRTPVRLRDFCKYVAAEEKDWLRREEELYRLQTAESMERLMRKSSEIYEETMLFRDEDFILPGTLKAKDLEKKIRLDGRKSAFDVDIPSNSSVEETVKSAKKEKGMGKKSPKKEKKKSDKSTGGKTSSKKSIVDAESSSITKKTSLDHSAEKELVYDFIGYDLGRLRVQMTNRKRTFYSADDTLVRAEIDDWLYKNKDLRITVTLNGYTLRLFHRIHSFHTNEIFHLTGRTGIIMAFQKSMDSQHKTEDPLNDWQSLKVDHRISWPTGLVIEPIIGDGPENPYYIQQSYIPKGYANTNGDREVRRKFLRNGTILKYLDNGSIIVLRPNGVIVACTAFKNLDAEQAGNFHDQANISKHSHVNASVFGSELLIAKGPIKVENDFDVTKDETDHLRFGNVHIFHFKGDKATEPKIAPKGKRKPTSSSKPRLIEVDEGDSTSTQRNSTTVNQNRDNVLSMANNTVKVSGYTVLNHDGERYEVLDDLVVSEQHRLLVRMASDYEVDEKFTRRADGTNMLLNSNGELIVRFPDGTRITTGYTIEKEPVMCDWSEEEILRYFTANGIKEDEEQYVEPSFSNLRNIEEASIRNTRYEEKITGLLIADSFVSVLLTCSMEHKNYATVSYDQSAVSCTLSMPDDLRVSISRRGHYEVSMADGVNLKIDENSLIFKGNVCTVCGSQSTSTYDFFPPKSAVIFATTDVFGNVFEVKQDGTTHYRQNVCSPKRKEADFNVDTVHPIKREDNYEEEILDCTCNHERLCFKSNDPRCRIFSVNRDLTAYEYIDQFVRNEIELLASFDEKISVITYPSERRSKLRRLITWEPVGNDSWLQEALSFPDYQLKPTNFDRRAVLRSTYSIPYDWLFPFGKNGNGVWENTHDLPLIGNVEVLPELLRIRILRGFKEPGENAVIDLQRALGPYWMSLVRGIFPPHVPLVEGKKIVKEKANTTYDRLDENLNDLALGTKKTIDVETYKMGLERQWRAVKAKAPRRSMKFDEFLGHKAAEKEELEWYKRCMRERFILPYFQNITGTCFLWVMDCMENALNMPVRGSFDEIGESQKYQLVDRDEIRVTRQNLD